ncbi:MAG: hypothetical protein ABIR84_09335 [Candidatus Nitrotoga sp.]
MIPIQLNEENGGKALAVYVSGKLIEMGLCGLGARVRTTRPAAREIAPAVRYE